MTRRLCPVEIVHEPGDGTLLCSARHDVPLVSVTVACPGGQSCSPREVPGLAELSAALFSEGSEGFSPLEWHRRLDDDALAMYASASTLKWTAHLECLSADLDEALALFQEWLARPALPASEWKRLVRSYRAGSREEWAQPVAAIDPLAAVQALGYGHPRAHPAFEKSYARARLEEARRLGRNAFRRGSGTTAAIGGDITVDEGLERLRQLLGALPAGPTDPTPDPEPSPGRKPVWILDHKDLGQVFFALSRPGVRADDPDRVALLLADHALGGGGLTSRLMQRVRAEMGHTYGIHSSLPMERAPGAFRIQSFTQVDNLGPMLELVENELDAVSSAGFTADEVEEARQHVHGSLPLRLTSPNSLLRAATGALDAGLSIETLEADWRALLQTSDEEVNTAAHRIIGDGSFRLALVGPAARTRPALEKRGDVAVFPFRTRPDRWRDEA